MTDRTLPIEVTPHTLGGFRGAFQSMFGTPPTEQEIWNAAIRSWRDLKGDFKEEKLPPFGSNRAAAFALYEGPFHFNHGYIYDNNSQMVADHGGSEDLVETHIAARVRGWGRIGYMPNAEVLQDTVGHLIAEALTDLWKKEEGK